jgi:cob(I)alamin adenosyltransferase
MAKIYTRTGDGGQTGLFAGPRVRKDDIRVEAYGTVDELNTVIGMARSESLPGGIDSLLAEVQNDLFAVGAELATPQPQSQGVAMIRDERVADLEAQIDRYDTRLAPLTEFILPGGCRGAALLHFGRAVCRRAERRVVALAGTPEQQVSERMIAYLNRLGDLLFVLARAANEQASHPDVSWQKPD